MRMLNRVALTAALLVPVVAAPASAQNWKFDWGVNGGYSWYSNMLGEDETGAENITFEPGWLLGTQLTFWASPRIGIRANGTYTDRPINIGGDTEIGAVNLWSASGDLLFRFATPNEEWMGSEFLPYLALGAGMKFINGAGGEQCSDGEDDFECHRPLQSATGGNQFALGDKNVFMGLVGLGADWRLSPGFALRLEVSDRIYKPHVVAAGTGIGAVGTENVAKTMHEVAGQIGLHLLMGLQRPEVVAVAPPPPPPPPPAEPPPAPREDAIAVCVIDPTSPNGIRMQNAIFVHATGDTVIDVNGTRTPLRQAVGTVQVARTADWYVRGEPLTLRVGRTQMQYLTYQGARQIEADRLTFLGTINGFPVYADRDQVADLNADLAELRTAQNTNDLADLLDERADVRGELEDIQYLYVPLEPTGCVFQTVQLLEQVRKGK